MRISWLLFCLLVPDLARCQSIPPLPPPAPTALSPATPSTSPVPPVIALAVPTPSIPPTHNFRVEVLVVDLPEEKALALLPELRDDTRIDGAYRQIIEAIQRKEATLVAYPVVFTPNDERATSETINEVIYPTEFQPPTLPQNQGGGSMNVGRGTTTTTANNDPPPFNLTGAPANFEKRNAGVTLEVNVTLPLPDKQWFKVDFEVQDVAFLGYSWFEVLKMPTLSSSVQQPDFFTMKNSASLLLRSGQRVLCGMHRLKGPTAQVELFILQATAVKIGG